MFLQGWKYLLLGAANDSPLCQMALAYRHLIGSDGLHQDCDVAIGRTLLVSAFKRKESYFEKKTDSFHSNIPQIIPSVVGTVQG